MINGMNSAFPFPYSRNNISLSPACNVEIFQLLRYVKQFFAYAHFLNQSSLRTNKLTLQVFKQLHLVFKKNPNYVVAITM